MGLTLLIDLDDTLLFNPMDSFQPAYLKTLGKRLAHHVAPEAMIHQLLLATEAMLRNQDPTATLEETFDRAFYPALGLSKDELRPAIDAFYADVFPSLREHTRPIPQAVEIVERALDAGNRVVVATNPLFPRTAILQRLEWAGITLERHPLTLVTTYETFHFAKPNPAYYAEILAQIGCPDGPVAMVGNSLSDDVLPAGQLGLHTFWVNPDHAHLPEGAAPPSDRGDLTRLAAWLEGLPEEYFPQPPTNPRALIAMLQATPAGLDTAARRLSPEGWRHRAAPGEWSLGEVACHLRDVDTEVYLPRVATLLREEDPFLPGIDTDVWAEERGYAAQDGAQALRDFIQTRRELIDLLRGLDPAGWQRAGRHSLLGPTTLQEVVAFIASHDRAHLQQAHRALAESLG